MNQAKWKDKTTGLLVISLSKTVNAKNYLVRKLINNRILGHIFKPYVRQLVNIHNSIFLKDFFSKCDQICSGSHLLKKSLIDNFLWSVTFEQGKLIWMLSFHVKFFSVLVWVFLSTKLNYRINCIHELFTTIISPQFTICLLKILLKRSTT